MNGLWQLAKTHCPAGHEYTPENTKLARSTKPGRFKRQCRACKAEVSKRARINAQLAKLAAAGDPTAPFPVLECDSPQEAQRASPVSVAGGDADVAADRRHCARPRSSSAGAAFETATGPEPLAYVPRPFRRQALRFLQWRRDHEREVERAISRGRFASAPDGAW